jgi:hypothetical protein
MAAVEYVLRMTGLPQAEQGLDAVAGAARGGAAALDALGQSATPAGNAIAGSMTEAQRATAQAEAALERLLYAQASGSQRAVMDLQKQVAGLDALAAAGADAATVERARALAAQQGAARIANALDIERGKAGQLAVDLDGLDVASRRSSQGLSSIAMQMPDVIAGLASGQSAVTVFMQQGLQVFQQNLSSLLPLLASVGPALAVVGTAAAALGGVYLYLADSVEEAEDAMARSAAAATGMQEAHEKLQDVQRDLADEIDLLTGAVTREELAQRDRDKAIRDSYAGVEAQLAQKREALKLELEAVKQGRLTIETLREQERLQAQIGAIDFTTGELGKRKEQELASSADLTFGQTGIREGREREEAERKAASAAKQRADDAAKAAREAQRASDDLRASEAEAMAAEAAQRRSLQQMEAQAAAQRAERTGSLLRLEEAVSLELALRQQDLAAAADRALAAGVDAAEVGRVYLAAAEEAELQAVARVAAAREAAQAEAHAAELERIALEAAERQRRAQVAGAAVGIAGSVARGNLGGAVTGLGAMLGPSAAALGPIGAAIGVAQGIGATAEAQGVSVADVTTQAVEGAVGALVAVVEGLPDIIAETIPVLVSALLVDLPVALITSLPDILAAAFEAALIGIPRAIGQAIAEVLGLGDDVRSLTPEEQRRAARIRRRDPRGQTGVEALQANFDAQMAALSDRQRATTSRSATTARRAATTRPSPAAAPNPFRAFADAYDGQFAGPFGASPTTPQLRGT